MRSEASNDGNQWLDSSVNGRMAEAVLLTRRAFQYRWGLILAVLGVGVLLSGMIQELAWGVGWGLVVLAGTALVTWAIVANTRQRRREKLWAKPQGEAALDSGPQTNPRALGLVQAVAVVVLVVLAIGAVRAGVSLKMVVSGIALYGVLHMLVYTLSLSLNLGLREQLLSSLWFGSSGLYWVATHERLYLAFGVGWLLTGLLLHRRWSRLERAFPPSNDTAVVP